MELKKYLATTHPQQDQGAIIHRLGIDEVDEGICFALATAWLARCAATPHSDPSQVWNSMLEENDAYFKQIARAQQTYLGKNPGKNLNLDRVEFFNLLTSSWTLDRPFPVEIDSPKKDVENVLVKSDGSMMLLRFDVGRGGHATGLAAYDGNVYLYDPNYGVFVASMSDDVRYEGLLKDLLASYGATNASGWALKRT